MCVCVSLCVWVDTTDRGLDRELCTCVRSLSATNTHIGVLLCVCVRVYTFLHVTDCAAVQGDGRMCVAA